MKQSSYVMMLNVGRTGSTWVSAAMGTHPEILDGCECNWFAFRPEESNQPGRYPLKTLYEVWSRPNILSPIPLQMLSPDDILEVSRNHLLDICGRALANSGNSVIVDKSPTRLLDPRALSFSRAVLPGAKVFHLVRDLRSVWLSYAHRYPEYWVVSGGVHHFCQVIERAYAALYEIVGTDIFTVRFEDMENGEFDWDTLWRFCGVGEGLQIDTPLAKHPIPNDDAEVQGVRIVTERLGELMSRWGYDVVTAVDEP